MFLFRVPCSGILKWERRRGTRQPGPRGTSQNRRRRPKRRILTSRTTIGSHFLPVISHTAVCFDRSSSDRAPGRSLAPSSCAAAKQQPLQSCGWHQAVAGIKRLPAPSGRRLQAAAAAERLVPPSGCPRPALPPSNKRPMPPSVPGAARATADKQPPLPSSLGRQAVNAAGLRCAVCADLVVQQLPIYL